MEINLNKKKAALYPHNTIAIKHCDVYWYNILHNLKAPLFAAPPPSPRSSYRQNLCPGDYEIYNFGKLFLGNLICLIHTPEITRRREQLQLSRPQHKNNWPRRWHSGLELLPCKWQLHCHTLNNSCECHRSSEMAIMNGCAVSQ